MKKLIHLFYIFLILHVNDTMAHFEDKNGYNFNSIIYIKNLINSVEIKNNNTFIEIRSNGIPDHEIGNFPGKGNPNIISEQFHNLKVTKFPEKQIQTTSSRFFGIAINGIMFIPGTAGCWGGNRRSLKTCQWSEEAIVNGKLKLGLDNNYGHVQRTGMYHYHGQPKGLLDRLKSNSSKNDLIKVGFAGDGFGIFVSRNEKYKPSYQLREGSRPKGPFGKFDGTYTNDFEFIPKSGDLDECNGINIEHIYIYLITKGFPYIPRCWVGKPDISFLRRPDN